MDTIGRPGGLQADNNLDPLVDHPALVQHNRRTALTIVRNIPTHVRLSPADGVDRDCAANLDGIQTIDKTQLVQKMVRLRHEKMEEIFTAIRAAFEMR